MIDSILDGFLRYISKFLSSFSNPKKLSNVKRLIKAILASKSAKPLSKIELIIKVFCFGKVPIIVSIFPAIKASKLDPVKGLKYE